MNVPFSHLPMSSQCSGTVQHLKMDTAPTRHLVPRKLSQRKVERVPPSAGRTSSGQVRLCISLT